MFLFIDDVHESSPGQAFEQIDDVGIGHTYATVRCRRAYLSLMRGSVYINTPLERIDTASSVFPLF